MTFKVATYKLQSEGDPAFDSYVFELEPEDLETKTEKGSLYLVVGLEGFGESGTKGGEKLVDDLIDRYFNDEKEASALRNLKKSIEFVLEKYAADYKNIQVSAACLVEDAVYLAAVGGAKVTLFRDASFIDLLVSRREVVSASGFARVNDLFILSTELLWKAFDKSETRQLFEEKGVEHVSEELAGKLHPAYAGRPPSDVGVCASFLYFLPDYPGGLAGDKGYERQDGQRFDQGLTRQIEAKGEEEKPGLLQKALFRLRTKFFNKDLHVKPPGPESGELDDPEAQKTARQRRKVSASVGFILIILLLASAFFGIRQKRLADHRASYEEVLQSAIHEFEEAEKIYSLNPARARDLFEESKGKVLGLSDQGVDDEELKALLARMQEIRGEILGEYEVQPETFVDLSLVSEGFLGDTIILSEDIVFVYDELGKRAIRVRIGSKRSEVVAGPEQLGEAISFFAYAGRPFILERGGVYEIANGKKSMLEEEFNNNLISYGYAGNFYVVDRTNSLIVRYPGVEGGFASGREWLRPDTAVDLSDATSMVIDGFIWVLKGNGAILRFSLGNQVRFAVSGVTPNLVVPTAIFTSEDASYLYILEPDSARVVVVSKDGEYKAQYFSERLRDAKGLIVSEGERKIIFLAGSNLYSINIRHLN